MVVPEGRREKRNADRPRPNRHSSTHNGSCEGIHLERKKRTHPGSTSSASLVNPPPSAGRRTPPPPPLPLHPRAIAGTASPTAAPPRADRSPRACLDPP